MFPRGNGAQISFIFFIDIIMSVSGVLMFTIMFFLLDPDCAVSTVLQSPAGPSKEDLRNSAEGLRRELDALQPKIDALEAQTRALTTHRPDDLMADMERLEQSIRGMKKETVAKDDTRDRLEENVAEARKNARALEHELRELALAKVNVENAAKRVVFSLPGKDTSKEVVVIEVSDSRMVLQPLSGEAPPRVIRDLTGAQYGVAALKELTSYPAAKHDVLLLLKPSGFEPGPRLIDAIRDKGYRLGYEPIEEDRTAIRW